MSLTSRDAVVLRLSRGCCLGFLFVIPLLFPKVLQAAGPAVDDAFLVPAESETWVDVLDNDNDMLTVETVDVEGLYVSAWFEDGVLKVLPRPGFLGPLDFTYVASDGIVSSTAIVHLTVRPQLRDDYAFTSLGRDVVIDVLGNDRGASSVLSLVQSSGGRATVEPDQRVRFSSFFPGRQDFFYDVDDGNGSFRRARVVVHVQGFTFSCPRCPGPVIPLLLAPDLRVETVANGEEILVSLPLGASPLVVGRDGAYGSVSLAGGQRLRYRPDRLHIGEDRFAYYVADGTGRWVRGVVTLDFQHPDLSHHFAFDGGALLANQVWDSTRPGTVGRLFNDGLLFAATPTRSAPAVVGAQSLDLTANDQGLMRVVAPVEKEEGTVSAWINFPAGLKFGTANDVMTIFATALDPAVAATGWSLTLEPTGPTTASIHAREGGDDFATKELEWEPGTWYHVAYLWSPLNRILTVDGIVFAESDPDDPARLASHVTHASAFVVGNQAECTHSSCGASFAGFLDEVKVFDRRLDLSDARRQFATENPAVSFSLGLDDLTRDRQVENLEDPSEVVELVQVQGAPYRVRSDIPDVGLFFGPGGGSLRWRPGPQSLDPAEGWLAWTIQLPDGGLSSDVVLGDGDGGLFHIAFEILSAGQAELVVRDAGVPILASNPLDLEPDQPLDVLLVWEQGKAWLLVDDEVVAATNAASFFFSRPALLDVSLAPGASLWMLQQGKPKQKPEKGRPSSGVKWPLPKQDGNDGYYFHSRPVVMWIPGKDPQDSTPMLWPGNADVDPETGFDAICKGTEPKKLGCKSGITAAVRQDAQDLLSILQRRQITTRLWNVLWWHRGEGKIIWEAGYDFETILKKKKLESSQFKGTGGATPKANPPGAPAPKVWGVATNAWTGFSDAGKPKAWCSGWGTPNPGFKGMMGEAKTTSGKWLGSTEVNCDQSLTVRCVCEAKHKIRIKIGSSRVEDQG